MNNQLPRVTRCCLNDVTMEVCHGPIPDVFKELWFDPIAELELPDTKVTDEEFMNWVGYYGMANPRLAKRMLEKSLCN